MATKTATNQNSPSLSVIKPKASEVGEITLNRLMEVAQINNNQAEAVATILFNFLYALSDEEIKNGKILVDKFKDFLNSSDFNDVIKSLKTEFPGIDNDWLLQGLINKEDNVVKSYAIALKGLFKLAQNQEIGSINHLNRQVVHDHDIATAARINCLSGGVLLDILCEVVNEETKSRMPTRILNPRSVIPLAPTIEKPKGFDS